MEEIQDSAGRLGIIGGIALVWAALGFFSVVESALNIVYGLPNRPFIRQKLPRARPDGRRARDPLRRARRRLGRRRDRAATRAYVGGALAYLYGIAISTALVLGFVWCIYTLLTNERAPLARDAAGRGRSRRSLLQASFQLLPLFVRATSGLIALQAFGGLALLLLWIYLMANVLVFGAEVNWYLARGRERADEEPAGLA